MRQLRLWLVSASQTWMCTWVTGDLATMQVLTQEVQAGAPGTSRSPEVMLTLLVHGPHFEQRETEVPTQGVYLRLGGAGFWIWGSWRSSFPLLHLHASLGLMVSQDLLLLPSKAAPRPQTLCLQTVPSIATLLPASSVQAPWLYLHRCPGLSDPSSG